MHYSSLPFICCALLAGSAFAADAERIAVSFDEAKAWIRYTVPLPRSIEIQAKSVTGKPLAAAGVKCEPGSLDGVNLVPFLGRSSGTPHRTLYWRTGDRRAIRSGNWKLIRLSGRDPQLYDLSSDPGETRNLAAEMFGKLKELDELFAKWNSQLARPLWPERPGGGGD